jgi:hypothetical protein
MKGCAEIEAAHVTAFPDRLMGYYNFSGWPELVSIPFRLYIFLQVQNIYLKREV